MSNLIGIRVHATNVTGLGAKRLLSRLLPELFRVSGINIECIYLPQNCTFVDSKKLSKTCDVHLYRRFFLKSLSRFFEVAFPSTFIRHGSPILVLGDIPLRCRTPQIVFLQNANFLVDTISLLKNLSFKMIISKILF